MALFASPLGDFCRSILGVKKKKCVGNVAIEGRVFFVVKSVSPKMEILCFFP